MRPTVVDMVGVKLKFGKWKAEMKRVSESTG
jgi:hypothetical protein